MNPSIIADSWNGIFLDNYISTMNVLIDNDFTGYDIK